MLKIENLKCRFVCGFRNCDVTKLEEENNIFQTKNEPDVTPMNFFLWGYIKQKVYATSPPILKDLQRCITDACTNVAPAMLCYTVFNVKFKQVSIGAL
ncbi:hypothetical protein AVEN_128597-1 [Araneus ventricosus]|uniref:Uncharacterized protein n=1 Tax=Araneus ventricosus TaxID=182803 RepID=A0A4Y2RJ88_ARAVE|nr:hypothetical protein AVEN_128597-1 [Araneus ventricosus]